MTRAEPVAGLATAERALRALDITLRRRVDGMVQGTHQGLRPGTGAELEDVRPYRPGEDDPRRIDWNVTARAGDPHVRATLAEPELESWVLVDGSASMDFGTAVMEKRDLAVAVVAAVHALTDRPGNRLGARVVGGAAPRTFPPRPGRRAARVLLRALLVAPRTGPGPAAVADLAAGLDRLHRERRGPGLRVVVSDFLPAGPEDPAVPGWLSPLRRLAARHDVVVVEVTDPRDAELPDVGLLTLLDPESGRTRHVRTGDRRLRDRYAQAVAEHRAGIARAVRAAGADHVVLRTDGDWVGDVARLVAARRRTRRRVPGRVR